MDLSRIIAAAGAQRAQALEEEAARLLGNARILAAHLDAVVRPVLAEAARQLTAAAIPTRVITLTVTPEMCAAAVTVALGLRLEPAGSPGRPHRLEFCGDYATLQIRVESIVAGQPAESAAPACYLATTTATATATVEAFVSAIAFSRL